MRKVRFSQLSGTGKGLYSGQCIARKFDVFENAAEMTPDRIAADVVNEYVALALSAIDLAPSVLRRRPGSKRVPPNRRTHHDAG